MTTTRHPPTTRRRWCLAAALAPTGTTVQQQPADTAAAARPDVVFEDRMAADAVAWMEANQGRPFFLNYWMSSIHAPFDAKPDLTDAYRGRVDPSDAQRSPTYAAMVESMDDAVGTLLDAIGRLGVADSTVVVFTSENGGNMYSPIDGTVPTSNRPLRGGKETIFDGGTRVPAVVAWPGRTEPGTRSDALLQSEDFYPTLLAGLGLEPAPDQVFDGVDIGPALEGEPFDRPPLVQDFPHNPPVPDWLPPSVSIHRGDWKLIRVFHGGSAGAHRHLLFDLGSDPGESNDLAAREPERVRELGGLDGAFLESAGALVPAPNPELDPAVDPPLAVGEPRVRRQPNRR